MPCRISSRVSCIHQCRQARADGPIAVVAPGTGLGEAFLVWNGNAYIACSSEGGHASFAPTDERQAGSAAISGAALRTCILSSASVPAWASPTSTTIWRQRSRFGAAAFADALARAADRTPLISQAGMADPSGNTLAAATLEMFVTILGDEAGNLALKVMATGGVYLAGGSRSTSWRN